MQRIYAWRLVWVTLVVLVLASVIFALLQST
jgi:hypothetical protein